MSEIMGTTADEKMAKLTKHVLCVRLTYIVHICSNRAGL